MQQTLIAILAMMLVGMYALNQNRRIAQMKMNMIQNEVATIATSVGMDRLEHIGTKAYDQATKNGKITSFNQLTDPVFPEDTQGDDIDDFNEASRLDTIRLGEHALTFEVSTTVSYAQESDPNEEVTGAAKTKYKRARASVQSLTVPMSAPIIVYRSYACGDRCDW